MRPSDYRVLSRPIQVEWAGWRTDTRTLQQAGWQLSAEQDVGRAYMRIAMRHPTMRMEALSDLERFNYREAIYDERYHEHVLLRCRAIAKEVHFDHAMVGLHLAAIDAEPQLWEGVPRKLADFAHFATPLARTEQIIVPPDTVPDLLDRILKLQAPGRIERIRAELRDDRPPPRQVFHAQIVSLAA